MRFLGEWSTIWEKSREKPSETIKKRETTEANTAVEKTFQTVSNIGTHNNKAINRWGFYLFGLG